MTYTYIKYIIKSYATAMLVRPLYTEAFDEKNMKDKVEYMKKAGDYHIRVVEYKNRDTQVEGALKRCRLGSERYNTNLRYLFYDNLEHEIEL